MAEAPSIPDSSTESFRCNVCKITADDMFAYDKHLDTKEHKKNFMKKKYGPRYLEVKAELDKRTQSNGHSKNDIHDRDPEKVQKSKSELKTNDNTNRNDNDEEPKDLISDDAVKSTTQNRQGQANSNSPTGSDSDDLDEDECYPCDICKKVVVGLVNYKLHIKGQKHLKKEKQLRTMKDLEKKNLIPNKKKKNVVPTDYTPPDLSILNELTPRNVYASMDIVCQECDVKCCGPNAYKQHIKGESHRKKVAKLGIEKQMKEDGILSTESKDDTEGFKCTICNKAFSGIVPYKQHMESLTHQKQEKAMLKLKKVKDEFTASDESSKLKCKTCLKVFSGPSPFEDHLNSSLHQKLEKKHNLYEELGAKYPEMKMVSITTSSDSEDGEEIKKPYCKICSVMFSGPEAAIDHFQSLKHKKAAKMKIKMKVEEKKKLKETKPLHSKSEDKLSVATEEHINESDIKDVDDSFEDDFEVLEDPMKSTTKAT